MDITGAERGRLYRTAFNIAHRLIEAERHRSPHGFLDRKDNLGRLLESIVRRIGEDRRAWAGSIIDAGAEDARAGRRPRPASSRRPTSWPA
jgi:hypothetical protein